MPAPLQPQPTIAFVWDFEHALITTPLLAPVLAAHNVDTEEFEEEVAGLAAFHAVRGETLSPDTARLLHLLAYVRSGRMKSLTNATLRSLGSKLSPAPGAVELIAETRARVRAVAEFAREGIIVEHYAVTTGPVVMVQGSVLGEHLDGMWGSTFLGERATPGYLDQLPVVAAAPLPLSHLGVAYEHSSAPRTLFEISKGVNREPTLHVDTRMGDDERRVPLANMVFVAGSTSWVPALSIVNTAGGKTLGVAATASAERGVARLHTEGRVHDAAPADYRSGQPAHDWLTEAVEQISHGIVEHRRRAFAGTPEAPPTA